MDLPNLWQKKKLLLQTHIYAVVPPIGLTSWEYNTAKQGLRASVISELLEHKKNKLFKKI